MPGVGCLVSPHCCGAPCLLTGGRGGNGTAIRCDPNISFCGSSDSKGITDQFTSYENFISWENCRRGGGG